MDRPFLGETPEEPTNYVEITGLLADLVFLGLAADISLMIVREALAAL